LGLKLSPELAALQREAKRLNIAVLYCAHFPYRRRVS
jgi:hypothetical protein